MKCRLLVAIRYILTIIVVYKLGVLAYILTQPKGEGKHKAIIQCGSAAFSSTQANYSVTELELLVILWSLQKASFYCKGAPKISVYTDHSALVTLTRKELIKVENTRLVSMLEKVADFNIEVFHLPGIKTPLQTSCPGTLCRQ